MKCCLFFLAFFLFDQINISGQEKSVIKFGEVSVKDFMLPASPVLDSSSGAVIIADIGSTNFIGNEYRSFSYVFKKYSRILILKNSAFDLATLKIPLYVRKDRKSQLNEVKASVYNLENGKVIKSEFNKKDLFENKINSFITEYKLTLPSVKEGSIIEYSYMVTSYKYFDIPAWHFQRLQYPCLYSEYEVIFPDALRFLVTNYGVDSFYKNETSMVKNNKYIMGDLTVISNDIKQRWVMKDVPSFKDEKFIYSPNDYLDKVEFTLAQTYNGEDIQNLRTSWYMVTDDLLNESYFGLAIEKDNSVNLFNTAEKVTVGDKSLLESARSIYLYIRDNFLCLFDDEIYLSDDLYNINKKKKGNVADLNLLLIALLRQKGIDADPVILSTREYGKNSPEYPLLEKMNYVICMTRAFGDTIYLDATRPYLGFGQLSLDCYNGHARVISNRIQGAVYLSPETIKEQQTTAAFIVNESNGISGGWVEMDPGIFGAEELRTEIRESGVKKYFEKIRSEFTNETEMLKPGIDSLNKPDFPAKVHFEFTFPVQGDVLYFNPVVLTGYKQNPFKPEKRKYPVSLPMPVNELYTLNMEIPDGYMIDELPKSAKVSFNENEGFFEYLVQANQQSIQLRSRISLPKVFYPSEDYQSLRDFYTFIVAKYSEQIVFKKKK